MKKTAENKIVLVAIYLLIVLSIGYFSLNPKGRVWGFNFWAYLSSTEQIILAAIALFGIGLAFLMAKYFERSALSQRNFTAVQTVLILLGLAFTFLLQVKTYFLGDGYTLLSNLSSGSPLETKNRQIAETITHYYLYQLLGGNGYDQALTTYQIISHTAFLIYAGLTLYLGKMLLKDDLKGRLLFYLQMTVIGTVLLYFGYVENYALFSCSILLFVITGIYCLDHDKPILIILALLITVLMHIFGVLFLPATLYILLRATRPGRWIVESKNSIRFSVFAVALLAALAIFAYLYSTNLFIRFSFVPLVNYVFTQEGYSLFSLRHLSDYGQLLFVLIPGLLFLLWSLRSIAKRTLTGNDQRIQFVGLIAAFALLGAFVFDPRLGMARDWDVFSFAAIPTTLLILLALFNDTSNRKRTVFAVSLSVILSLVVLGSRAYTLHDVDASVSHFKDYLSVDRVKNRNSWLLLYDHYIRIGDSTQAQSLLDQWYAEFPEKSMMHKVQSLYENNDISGALTILRQVQKMNPTYPDLYVALGQCYVKMGIVDSAILFFRYADAFSPNRSNTIGSLAAAYTMAGDLDKAESYFLKASRLDTLNYIYPYNLSVFYTNRKKNVEKIFYYLEKAVEKKSAPLSVHRELMAKYLKLGKFDQARALFDKSELLQTDTAFIREANKRFPGLGNLQIK